MYYCDKIQDENGPIFIREKGELHIVRSESENPRADSSYSSGRVKKSPRLFGKGFCVKLCIGNDSQTQANSSKRKEHFIFTYTKEGSLRYSAKSLFKIALLFIGENVQHIDSLKGFPEQMAEQLFAVAEEKRKFSDAELGSKVLRLFSEAYGELVLKSLCLRNRFLLVSEKLEEIKLFRNLQSLDLFGCKVGDNHEILPHLTSDALSSLTQLFLGDNCLTDNGLRKLTAPIRVMQRGLGQLKLLDLSYVLRYFSDNPISDRALAHLSYLPNLQRLDISGTNVKLSMRVCDTLHDTVGLVYSEVPLMDFCHTHCNTHGWAEQIINQWEESMSELSKPKASLQGRANALRFYGRKFMKEKCEDSSLECKDIEKCNRKERLHFCRADTSSQRGTSSGAEDPVASLSQNKRKGGAEPWEAGSEPGPPPKRHATPLTSEDWDLLNSY